MASKDSRPSLCGYHAPDHHPSLSTPIPHPKRSNPATTTQASKVPVEATNPKTQVCNEGSVKPSPEPLGIAKASLRTLLQGKTGLLFNSWSVKPVRPGSRRGCREPQLQRERQRARLRISGVGVWPRSQALRSHREPTGVCSL